MAWKSIYQIKSVCVHCTIVMFYIHCTKYKIITWVWQSSSYSRVYRYHCISSSAHWLHLIYNTSLSVDRGVVREIKKNHLKKKLFLLTGRPWLPSKCVCLFGPAVWPAKANIYTFKYTWAESCIIYGWSCFFIKNFSSIYNISN